MRFRFCGDNDCPDWLLMHINTFSKLTPTQLQELCEVVVQPLIAREELDYKKLQDFSKDASLERNDVKACVSALTHILRSGSCYAVSPNDLGQELEQLGLDRVHSQVIVKVFSNKKDEIMSSLKEDMLRFGKINGISATSEGSAYVFLDLSYTGAATREPLRDRVRMSKDQARELLAELKGIKTRMEELQRE